MSKRLSLFLLFTHSKDAFRYFLRRFFKSRLSSLCIFVQALTFIDTFQSTIKCHEFEPFMKAQEALIAPVICNCNAGQACFACVLCSVDSEGPSMQMASLIIVAFQQRLRSTVLACGMTGGNTPITQSWSTKQMAWKTVTVQFEVSVWVCKRARDLLELLVSGLCMHLCVFSKLNLLQLAFNTWIHFVRGKGNREITHGKGGMDGNEIIWFPSRGIRRRCGKKNIHSDKLYHAHMSVFSLLASSVGKFSIKIFCLLSHAQTDNNVISEC